MCATHVQSINHSLSTISKFIKRNGKPPELKKSVTNKQSQPKAQNFSYITDDGTRDHGAIVAVN